MRRALLGFLLLPCGLRAQQPRATVILPGFRGSVWMDTTGLVSRVPGPPGSALSAARAAFAELGIAVESDSVRGLIGNLRLQTQRRFVGQQMSRLLDCGVRDQGPNADFYRINMAIMALTTPAGGDSTDVRVAFAAGAQAFGGPLADPVPCSSTGALELRLFDLMAARTGRGTPPSHRD